MRIRVNDVKTMDLWAVLNELREKYAMVDIVVDETDKSITIHPVEGKKEFRITDDNIRKLI
jgi:hypothetical protein